MAQDRILLPLGLNPERVREAKLLYIYIKMNECIKVQRGKKEEKVEEGDKRERGR